VEQAGAGGKGNLQGFTPDFMAERVQPELEERDWNLDE
jgi:hypothetical protein